MKRKLSWLPILALVFGVSSAFTSKIVNTESKRVDTFYWFNTSGTYHDKKTVSSEQGVTGCTGSSILCENGYNKNQLVDPNNPSLGVRSGEMPAAQIFQP